MMHFVPLIAQARQNAESQLLSWSQFSSLPVHYCRLRPSCALGGHALPGYILPSVSVTSPAPDGRLPGRGVLHVIHRLRSHYPVAPSKQGACSGGECSRACAGFLLTRSRQAAPQEVSCGLILGSFHICCRRCRSLPRPSSRCPRCRTTPPRSPRSRHCWKRPPPTGRHRRTRPLHRRSGRWSTSCWGCPAPTTSWCPRA